MPCGSTRAHTCTLPRLSATRLYGRCGLPGARLQHRTTAAATRLNGRCGSPGTAFNIRPGCRWGTRCGSVRSPAGWGRGPLR
ncbi:MAG: hypothetical protein WCK89_14365 [bacterium]